MTRGCQFCTLKLHMHVWEEGLHIWKPRRPQRSSQEGSGVSVRWEAKHGQEASLQAGGPRWHGLQCHAVDASYVDATAVFVKRRVTKCHPLPTPGIFSIYVIHSFSVYLFHRNPFSFIHTRVWRSWDLKISS